MVIKLFCLFIYLFTLHCLLNFCSMQIVMLWGALPAELVVQKNKEEVEVASIFFLLYLLFTAPPNVELYIFSHLMLLSIFSFFMEFCSVFSLPFLLGLFTLFVFFSLYFYVHFLTLLCHFISSFCFLLPFSRFLYFPLSSLSSFYF